MAIAIVVGWKNVILEKNVKIKFIDTDKRKKILKKTLDTSLFKERS